MLQISFISVLKWSLWGVILVVGTSLGEENQSLVIFLTNLRFVAGLIVPRFSYGTECSYDTKYPERKETEFGLEIDLVGNQPSNYPGSELISSEIKKKSEKNQKSSAQVFGLRIDSKQEKSLGSGSDARHRATAEKPKETGRNEYQQPSDDRRCRQKIV